MKKQYIRTIICSSGTYNSGQDCALITLFRLYDSKAGLFEDNLFWVRQYDSTNLHNGRRTNPLITYLNTILKQPI